MAMAYTSGLQRKEFCIIRRIRRLPLAGEILVKKGEKITDPTTVMARTKRPGAVMTVNAALVLQIEATIDEYHQTYECNIDKYMFKKKGDQVKKGEIIARRKSFFGLSKREVKSPINGTIELLSNVTGQILIRGEPINLEIKAYISGTVIEIIPNEGCIIETSGAFIQGVFGLGGETFGEIMILSNSEEDVLREDMISNECKGKVIVGGSMIVEATVKKAIALGVKGIIVGGMIFEDITKILGRQVGVAITGYEQIGLTIILTEGFGKMRMASKTFNLLKKFESKLACINGATQIRAGVIRPEIVIPMEEREQSLPGDKENLMTELTVGLPVRIVRDPFFGAIGRVSSLPIQLQKVENENYVRVLEVELEDGRKVIVPRANVEVIEE